MPKKTSAWWKNCGDKLPACRPSTQPTSWQLVATKILYLFVVLVLVALPGCGPTVQDRARIYNEEGVYLYSKGEYQGAGECFQEVDEVALGRFGRFDLLCGHRGADQVVKERG